MSGSIILSVSSRVNDDAKKVFSSSAINFESELISPFRPFKGPTLSLTCCFFFYILVKRFSVSFNVICKLLFKTMDRVLDELFHMSFNFLISIVSLGFSCQSIIPIYRCFFFLICLTISRVIHTFFFVDLIRFFFICTLLYICCYEVKS